MKNIIRFVALIITIAFCLCGCSFATDETHAVAEMTATTGWAGMATSSNGLGMTWSGTKSAMNNVYRVVLPDEEEVLKIHFFCDACGHDEECELNAPASKMFKCGCPEEGDENNNAKEYLAVLVAIESDDELAEATE